jgi:ParB family chromosome partitioning protein
MAKAAELGKRRPALGRGLDALLPRDSAPSHELNDGPVTYRRTDRLVPGPHQPRRNFSEESLKELADSIQRHGLLQPLIVRPASDGRYEIVAGERRWRAATLAGYDSIPVSIRELSDSEALEISLIENLQREDLNPMETAEAYDVLIRTFSYTHEALAHRLGKDRSAVTNQLRLLRLPEPIREMLREGAISMGHARALLGVEALNEQLRLAGTIVDRGLSVRELERIIQARKNADSNEKDALRANRSRKDPETEALERRLSSHLSTKAVIRAGADGGGKLEIHFHSADELERLLELMGYKEDFS